MIAVSHADAATVLSILDYPAYFELLDQPFPEDREKILSRLADDRLIVRDSSAKWDITQLGAILFARNLQEIKSLARKAIRIVVYKTERFLDSPPRSRNEALASFMRRIGICEERGSGVDKVVSQTELHLLPAPVFETPPDSTRAVLFAHKALKHMDRAERSRACYLHASLRYVERDPMTNSSLRARFGRKRLIQVQRELKAGGKPFRAFEVLNLGRYERQAYLNVAGRLTGKKKEQALARKEQEFRDLILKAYRAEPLPDAALLPRQERRAARGRRPDQPARRPAVRGGSHHRMPQARGVARGRAGVRV